MNEKIKITIEGERALSFQGEVVEVLEDPTETVVYFEVEVNGKLEPCELTVTRAVQQRAKEVADGQV